MSRPLGVFASAVHIDGGGAFNPLTQVTALHAMWAGDPSWSNPGDGNPVDSWRNQSGGGDPASTGTNRPTYRASVANLGNKPAIEFAGASSQRLAVDIADQGQSFKLLAVFRSSSTSGNPVIIGQGGNTGNGFRLITTGPAWRLVFNVNLQGGTADTNSHVLRATVNGASSQFWIDESSIASGDAGNFQLTYLTVGSGNSGGTFANPFTGYVAFYGVYSGATSDASLTTLANDLRTHYGF